MHETAFRQMELSVVKYAPKKRHLNVLDVGARNSREGLRTHREALGDRNFDYIGIDLQPGPNVDRVMPKPYTFPVKSRSIDLVFSGQVFEHIPFPWVTMLEISRVLKPGGLLFLTAPSRGHQHNVYDCWRYYPDAYRALAAWSKLRLLEVFADLPPTVSSGYQHDYAAIDPSRSYWGDAGAVFRKPADYPEVRAAALRIGMQLVANRVTSLPTPKNAKVDRRRKKIHVA